MQYRSVLRKCSPQKCVRRCSCAVSSPQLTRPAAMRTSCTLICEDLAVTGTQRALGAPTTTWPSALSLQEACGRVQHRHRHDEPGLRGPGLRLLQRRQEARRRARARPPGRHAHQREERQGQEQDRQARRLADVRRAGGNFYDLRGRRRRLNRLSGVDSTG
eukprot:6182311-Pleurochrysis_carterae.AAC.1